MTCPDELTLELWLADALPPDEAETVAAHVRGCAACAAVEAPARALGVALHAALQLDDDERMHLAGLGLAEQWRTSSSSSASFWGGLALAVVVGAYVAWLVASPVLGPVAAVAARVSLGTAPLSLLFDLIGGVGPPLVDLVRHPSLGLTQPLLAALAIALLIWPRQSLTQRRTSA